TVDLQLLSSGAGGGAPSADISRAARALQQQLAAGKTISVAYSNGAAVGVYSGARIDTNSTSALLQRLIDTAATANTTILQLCGGGRNARSALGVIASSNGLAAVQGALAAWNNATCATLAGASSSTISTTVYQSPLAPTAAVPTPVALAPRASATCRAIQVVSGDSCATLATECSITPAQFTSFNPSPTECSALKVGEWVCCSAGALPDLTPKPSANGTCFTYLIAAGDSCASIAAAHSLTVDAIGGFNTDTWGWVGCGDLLADTNICLSTGKPPMPAPMSNAVCGPQVPGSTPSSALALADYNQCVLQACCDIWGQCGTTSDFCTPSNSSTRARGTAAPGRNGCISNCGTEIISDAHAPAAFMNIAYFEAFNWQRPCLNMEVTQISSAYTHIHFGFANLTTGFEIDIGDQQIQFQLFTGMLGVKRILSIGGWAFSTDPSTYNIFREGVTAANRDALVSNIVNFVNQYGLDGVDIDWEYPGEPDIPGIPAGSVDDGTNYVLFLRELRTLLPSSATLSITAPSSYFYLKQFQIQATADFVDYIVFMTYDLHGQWDYNSTSTNPGCPTGNCLRSHVNLTETMEALSMITKAGVPSHQIAVGVASYGRSFQMVNPSCTGPECFFTGPLSGAQPGPCTATPGYIANAELNLIIANKSIASTSFTDTASDSNVLVWGDNWAAYMTDANKAARTLKYQGLNFAGTADWAVDVQAFEPGSAP
ncbi:glycoside hydrolase superfamily, partial [Mycena pura]